MTFDDVRLTGLAACRFDDVGIDRALREELDAAGGRSAAACELLRLFVEHLDEETADDLALGLGVGHTLQMTQKLITGVDVNDLGLQPADEHVHHQCRFIEAQQAVITVLTKDLPRLIAQFQASRKAEGAALHRILAENLKQMEELITQALATLKTRADSFEENFRAALARLKQDIDPERLAQEMAILAVKSDVTEEIDRLQAHIAAAQALLTSDGPSGRKFDFLMQEFNREANTLCSKSGSKALTAIGLEMKVLIDQMREQVQNVE